MSEKFLLSSPRPPKKERTARRSAQELLELLLPLCPPSLLSAQNNAGSTALHWAALNAHLATARALVEFPRGPGIALIDVKNAAGRSPLGEAEAAGWDEGAKWMVEVMRLDNGDDNVDDNGGDGGSGESDSGARGADEEDRTELSRQPADADIMKGRSS